MILPGQIETFDKMIAILRDSGMIQHVMSILFIAFQADSGRLPVRLTCSPTFDLPIMSQGTFPKN
jgi:hypothetical protein